MAFQYLLVYWSSTQADSSTFVLANAVVDIPEFRNGFISGHTAPLPKKPLAIPFLCDSEDGLYAAER